MSESGNKRKGFFGWLGNTLERRSRWVIVGTLVITVLLFLPLFMMAPTEEASDNPTGSALVKLDEQIEDIFSPEVYDMFFVMEARDGDMLTQEGLYELYQNEQELKESDLAPFLYSRYLDMADATVEGVYTIADAVNTELLLQSGGSVDLSNATDLQVKQAVDSLLNDPVTEDLAQELSVKAEYGENGWTSPALVFSVWVDEGKVEEEYPASIGKSYSEEVAMEHFGRGVQETLRGVEHQYQLWGVAIDPELEAEEGIGIAAIMLLAAMLLMAVLLLIIFRSGLIALVAILGLGMLIVWLKGFPNLIGLNSAMIVDFILPIAIIVLGVDYAIHALFRYREERDKGKPPRQALGDSTYRVGTALVLAMLTTVIAFSSNASSSIESVVVFAITASFAIFAALIILGFFVPTVVMRYQAWRSRGAARSVAAGKGTSRGTWLGSLVLGVSNRWFVVLPLILIVTGFAVWGWINVETRMDPEDAFDPGSDFVIGLDKVDEHAVCTGEEPALLYIEGDFTQHEALDAIKVTIAEMEDDQYVSRSSVTNKPNPSALLLDLLETVVEEDYAREQIQTASGVEITDLDGDLIPDTQEQLQAVYDYVTVNGLPRDEDTLVYTAEYIGESFVHGKPGVESDATLITIGVPSPVEGEKVKASKVELNEDMDAAMGNVDSIDSYGLTGESYLHVEILDAIPSAMMNSLIIAVAAVLALLLVVFRSLRYAIMTIIPVLLVACWLYGFMYVMDYPLNIVTATIAAIAIGVGIDFSIHFTQRFREELRRSLDKKTALRETARTTGFALFGTALTTAVGFAVIAFAPMPAFATFGVLTAVMIALSLFMALFVLPSLLLLFAPGNVKTEEE